MFNAFIYNCDLASVMLGFHALTKLIHEELHRASCWAVVSEIPDFWNASLTDFGLNKH